MQDRSAVQQRRNEGAGSGRHAVVVGGSIGGMLAARALADQFDKVTIIERDQLPDGDSENRPGVPHARHLHFFFKRGLMVVEELFPGVTADLLASGSHLLDQGRDFRILYRSGWSPRAEIGLEFCTFTRPLLEATIRRHLMTNTKINLLQGFEVAGLVTSEDGARVEGVRIQPRHHDPNALPEVETLAAELVIDTSGRGSKAPEWLEAAGFAKPEETVVDAFWGYATRIYEPVEDYKKDWKTLFLMNRPPHQPRAGIIQPIEGNRWLVTIAGVMHDYPPTDEEGFLKFARSLSSPELYRAIEHAKPLSRVWGYRRTENRLRHYDKASVPQGFAALGDSVCAFNPVYGVGMTLTGLEALALRKCLRDGKGRLDSQRFQKRVAKLVAGPWALTTGEDLRWPATEGGNVTAKVKFMHWYIEQVIRLIPQSQEIFRRFQEVNHMIKAPTALFHPAVLGPVLRQAFGPRRKGLKLQTAPAPARATSRQASTSTSTIAIRH
ncbi:MAG TPA: NAD(P)-binding protein [Thermoanaerobaculia bacterium]|jgi:2-polyprenyl-6-methoxyphenol hydroxylase-like FAD-dependent oxidoreductase|nr:NAD(P)-binding protein [Thermoanaerobaculia bacterium]